MSTTVMPSFTPKNFKIFPGLRSLSRATFSSSRLGFSMPALMFPGISPAIAVDDKIIAAPAALKYFFHISHPFFVCALSALLPDNMYCARLMNGEMPKRTSFGTNSNSKSHSRVAPCGHISAAYWTGLQRTIFFQQGAAA